MGAIMDEPNLISVTVVSGLFGIGIWCIWYARSGRLQAWADRVNRSSAEEEDQGGS